MKTRQFLTAAKELHRGDTILEFGQKHSVYAGHGGGSDGIVGYLKGPRIQTNVFNDLVVVVLEVKNHNHDMVAVKILLPDGRAGFIISDKQELVSIANSHA